MTSRAWAVGDPQTSPERFFAVLAAHGLLRDDGDLQDGFSLLSVGDHFDYGTVDTQVQRAGITILEWLSRQAGAHVLFGNHDLGRVGELASFDDDRFQEARALAAPIEALRKARGGDDPEVVERTEAFWARFPELPTTEIADRDYSAFTTEQRALVQRLLLERRADLARVVVLPDGREAVATHAGVTTRELDALGMDADDVTPRAVASALNAFLRDRVDDVRPAWERGELAPLDLLPLHRAGGTREEGGGMLYHRPTNPGRPGADPTALALQLKLRRRFDARELPRGLVQVCGHVSHEKCLIELAGFDLSTSEAVTPGDVRKLVVGDEPAYGAPSLPEPDGAAVLWLIDGGMNRVAPEAYRLLELAAIRDGSPGPL